MHTIRNAAILFVILLAAALAAPLSPAPARAAETVTLTTAPEGWEPFIIAAPRQAGRDGILVEVFREIAKKLGHDFRRVSNPDKQGLMMVRQGRLDAAPKAREWVSGPERYLWTDGVVTSSDTVLSRNAAPVPFQAPADLKGRTVGIIEGFKYPKLAAFIDNGAIKAVRAAGVADLLSLLMHGKIDCAVVNGPAAKWAIRNRGDINSDDLVFSRTPLDSAPLRFAFTGGDKWKPFIARFNAELAEMKKNGRLSAILSRYQ
ncbi:MAG: transporter substrate-binding domain-containing protein [Pseudodesulfovibrio sp.]